MPGSFFNTGFFFTWHSNMFCSSRLAPWNYLTAQLNRTSEHGDPDLYGMFWGGFSGQVGKYVVDAIHGCR